MAQKIWALIFLCSILGQGFDIFRLKSTYRKRNFCTDSEQEAYDYLRAAIQTDENYKFDRLRYDFETPAAELAAFTGGMVTTAQIMDCRYAAGDVWIFDMRYAARNRRTDAINAYLNGKITAEALAEQLNTIYGE